MGLLERLGWNRNTLEPRRFPSGEGVIICFSRQRCGRRLYG
jgi:hypothetical protein